MDVYCFFSLEPEGYHPTCFHCIIITKLFYPCLNDLPHSFLPSIPSVVEPCSL